MDSYEATKVVMSRIQALDPENASKIMGYILIQDQGEKEMIRLAFGPETLLLSHMNQAKVYLGLIPSNTPSFSYPPSPFPQSSPRILIPNNGGVGFHHLSSSNPSSPADAFPRSSPRPVSYASVLNCSTPPGHGNGSGHSNLQFYGGSEFGDQLSFLDDSMVDPIMSPSGRSDSLVFPYGDDSSGGIPSPHSHNPFHRRSCSVNDAAFLANPEEMGGGSGFGWRPCMYFARGFCKNGSTCKFLHGDGEGIEMGSSLGEGDSSFDELLRMKALQHQRFALMAASGGHGHHPFGYSKCMNFLNENPRNEFGPMGLSGCGSSSSRQIYLTFPADSTFKEEDVSGYFSMFGPVQDVRIPYQQKRMFGFVTFVYPETVNLILAKGNPHFVCDSRVLVKPYKEKGKILEKKHQQLQHMDSGEYSASLSPSGIDSREHFDLPFGSRMMYNTQETMLRRKLEQEAELQHALELQGRRMMNLQLMDLKNQHHNHNFLPSSSSGVPVFSPRQSQFLMNQNGLPSSDVVNREVSEESDGRKEATKSTDIAADNEKVATEVNDSFDQNTLDSGNKQHHVIVEESDLPESLEHIFPDNLFASPTKSATEQQSAFSQAFTDDNMSIPNTSSNKTASLLPGGSPLGMASLKSCYFQMPSH